MTGSNICSSCRRPIHPSGGSWPTVCHQTTATALKML